MDAVAHRARTFHGLVPNCEVPPEAALASRAQQPAAARWRGHATEPRLLALAWLLLGAGWDADEESFPFKETFTFLCPHVTELQTPKGKARREVQQKTTIFSGKPILPHKHWDPEQRDNQIWGGSLGKNPSAQRRNVAFQWHMTVAVRTAEHPQQH